MNAHPDPVDPAVTGLLGDSAYRESLVSYGGVTYWLERTGDGLRLVAVAEDEAALDGLAGARDQVDGRTRLVGDTSAENALALRRALPWLTPTRFGLHTSVGFGDRLGLATPGHVDALNRVGAALNPVFAQQSIREMGRCHRTPRNVLDDATWGAFQAGWTKPVGADADHLEQLADV
ncbi:MAG: tagaturonate epimerase family protein, partial [Actinomycetia bacterium]|nr:tagaturonate epimerase family protein [Actinomycetes bacterium]